MKDIKGKRRNMEDKGKMIITVEYAPNQVILELMFKKLFEIEKRLFSAPYIWLVKKGVVTILKTSKKIYRTAEDFYESRYDEPFDQSPNTS